MSLTPFNVSQGSPYPFGVTAYLEGFNFSIISTLAKSVSLCLFSPSDTETPLFEVKFDPIINKTGHVWHIALNPLSKSNEYLYMYRVDDMEVFLSDPYAKVVVSHHNWGNSSPSKYRPYGSLASIPEFDWKNTFSPKHPVEKLVIYEMHVRGFTNDPSSKANAPGTYLGIIEKIPHLLDLGVNAIELLPVHEFNETEYIKKNPITGLGLCNYWGYSTINFFSPMKRYAQGTAPFSAINEFKTMVRELHRNRIEVILDVVYNHTGEGNEKGPTYSFKGLDNDIYYFMNDGHYQNYSGCGNTFSCNHPISRELILDSLRYWATEMHVDGFRFDLASILTRGLDGNPHAFAPILEDISSDPILANCKLIAEPWDAAGLYQVGSFFLADDSRWSEWNARYRDVMRRFIKGSGQKGAFAANLCGSQDLYYRHNPCHSLNFIIAHDGFTLNDLVSYNHKHNLENGEHNRDGADNNESWNCSVEGVTTDEEVLALRERQMKNYHLALMLSRGIPMVHMGDEYKHTKFGNNNTWCQDNFLNWFLWDELELNRHFFHFYKSLIHFRKSRPILNKNMFFASDDIDWHSKEPFVPKWEKPSRFIAFTLRDTEGGRDLYAAFNASNVIAEIELPINNTNMQWSWIVDTSKKYPHDFFDDNQVVFVAGTHLKMEPFSSILLEARTIN